MLNLFLCSKCKHVEKEENKTNLSILKSNYHTDKQQSNQISLSSKYSTPKYASPVCLRNLNLDQVVFPKEHDQDINNTQSEFNIIDYPEENEKVLIHPNNNHNAINNNNNSTIIDILDNSANCNAWNKEDKNGPSSNKTPNTITQTIRNCPGKISENIKSSKLRKWDESLDNNSWNNSIVSNLKCSTCKKIYSEAFRNNIFLLEGPCTTCGKVITKDQFYNRYYNSSRGKPDIKLGNTKKNDLMSYNTISVYVNRINTNMSYANGWIEEKKVIKPKPQKMTLWVSESNKSKTLERRRTANTFRVKSKI